MYSINFPPRQNYFDYFGDLVATKFPQPSSVLEIGAGAAMHPALQRLAKHFDKLTGIDPDEEVLRNPYLDAAIHSRFEDWDSNGEVFDHAFSFNVLEHLRDPVAFSAKLASVVKPGGWFWALTPHANHPFARLSRFTEVLGLKSAYRRLMRTNDGYHGINDYSSYYRLNNVQSVRRFMCVPYRYFDQAEFILMDASWDSYFPSLLKWIPNGFDATVTQLFPRLRLIFVFGVRIADPKENK